MDKKKVIIGLSGGVDSSVAAYLLKKEGYDVIGVTMRIWEEKGKSSKTDEQYSTSKAVEDARRVAATLDIPYYVMSFEEIFKEKVIKYFIEEYGKGRTPNPCVICNKKIKFDELLKKAFDLDAYYIATGHYAKIEYDNEISRYLLKKSKAKGKDQTYFLYDLSQEQLKHILMPLGSFNNKEEVRKIAKELGLEVAEKKESQEICFIEDNDYARFIRKNAPYEIKKGYFIDTKGNILGEHEGITNYTIGQRKGLGLALGKPAYVVEIDPKENIVVIGDAEDVFGTELIADKVNYISIKELNEPLKVEAKIRYTSKEEPATIYPIKKNMVRVVFDNPVRAITPGQAVVFYNDDVLVGGGTIMKKVK